MENGTNNSSPTMLFVSRINDDDGYIRFTASMWAYSEFVHYKCAPVPRCFVVERRNPLRLLLAYEFPSGMPEVDPSTFPCVWKDDIYIIDKMHGLALIPIQKIPNVSWKARRSEAFMLSREYRRIQLSNARASTMNLCSAERLYNLVCTETHRLISNALASNSIWDDTSQLINNRVTVSSIWNISTRDRSPKKPDMPTRTPTVKPPKSATTLSIRHCTCMKFNCKMCNNTRSRVCLGLHSEWNMWGNSEPISSHTKGCGDEKTGL